MQDIRSGQSTAESITSRLGLMRQSKSYAARQRVVREALRLFVQHGARYCFAPLRGELTRGLPTGYAAAPLEGLIVAPASEPPPVWPDPHGTRRGMTLHPLYPSVPEAARRNPALYELLALFDAVRAGSPRERALALPLIEERLQS